MSVYIVKPGKVRTFPFRAKCVITSWCSLFLFKHTQDYICTWGVTFASQFDFLIRGLQMWVAPWNPTGIHISKSSKMTWDPRVKVNGVLLCNMTHIVCQRAQAEPRFWIKIMKKHYITLSLEQHTLKEVIMSHFWSDVDHPKAPVHFLNPQRSI